MKAHHVALSVRNTQKSIDFYAKLGFHQVHQYTDDKKTNTHMQLGDFYIEIFCFKKNADKQKLQLDLANDIHELGVKHFAIGVDDIDEALSSLKRSGLANETTEIFEKQGHKGNARFFFIKDPDGIWLELIKDERY